MAVPWPNQRLLGVYHVRQAEAARDLGADVRLFSPAPALPEWTARFSSKCRAHLVRPVEYAIEGIPIYSPRTPYAFPRFARYHVAPRFPASILSWTHQVLQGPLDQACESWRPDAILAHGVVPWGSVALELGERLKVPVGFIEHSADDVMRLRRDTRLGKTFIRHAQRADALFAAGPHMVSHLNREMGLTNCRFLQNGATVANQAQLAYRRPPELGDGPIIVSAANYYRRKGFEELVEAFESCQTTGRLPQLHLFTNAPPSLHRQIAESPACDRITLHGLIPHFELVQWLAWADLFAMPSWSEAFGIAYVDALGARTPVVMTTDCGLRSLLDLARPGRERPGQHGWVVPPGETEDLQTALEAALEDPERLRSMGYAGREIVESSFSWKRNAEGLLRELFGPSTSTRESTRVRRALSEISADADATA